jgi:hypothetical protein
MKNQKGFSLVEALLLIITLTLIGFAGWYVWNTNHEDKKKDIKTTGTSDETQAKVKTDPTSSWTAYTDQTGTFSLKYPSNWVKATNPDMCTEGIFLAGPTVATAGKCGSDALSEVIVLSAQDDVRSTYHLNAANMSGAKLLTTDVTANGVKGIKQTYTVTKEPEGIGPEIGTTEVRYVFYAKGYTYVAIYSQRPNDPDVLRDFDLLVTKTLKFN